MQSDTPNIDPVEVEESVRGMEELPEAPLSLHIDAYYKGFHTGITIRSGDNTKVPGSKIKGLIDSLIASGFEPSWNTDTNAVHSNGHTLPAVPSVICGVHGMPMKLIPAGISKKTNKAYNAFYVCESLNADGTKCNWKPDLIKKGL